MGEVSIRVLRNYDQQDAFQIWKDGIVGRTPVIPLTNHLT